jgi:hypothetical protein
MPLHVENDDIHKTLNAINSYLIKNINPKLININSSLKYYVANSPSIDSTELIYGKDNLSSEYVLRYDGKIKPTFVKDLSQRYVKETLLSTDNKLQLYGKYSKTQLEPLYPSINYCSIKTINNCNDVNYPIKDNDNNTLIQPTEYAWFNNGKNLVLKETITFDITEDDLKEGDKSIDILKAVENNIKKYYWNIIDIDTESKQPDTSYDKVKLQFIYDTYEIEYDHFYETETVYNKPVTKHNCHIKLTLK